MTECMNALVVLFSVGIGVSATLGWYRLRRGGSSA